MAIFSNGKSCKQKYLSKEKKKHQATNKTAFKFRLKVVFN
jgi:hypothetical protein